MAAPKLGAAGRLRWLSWLLIGLGVLRLLQVVLHSPMVGYANQYDMVRAHACLGLWPAGLEIGAAFPQAPVERLVPGPVDVQNCHASTDVLLARVALVLPRIGSALSGADADASFSLRWVGATKALLLVGLALLLQWRLARQPKLQLGHALVFALLLCDPLNSLFLNTLYTEFGALIGSYALFAALLLSSASGNEKRAIDILLLSAWGALALALSRFQHLPVLLGCAALLWLANRDRAGSPAGRLLGLTLVAALGLGLASHREVQQRIPGIPLANRSDTLFGALLPASSDRAALLRQLELPVACDQLSFSNWYVRRGHDPVAECPEAFELSHARIGLALLRDPSMAVLALLRALPQSTAWRLNYVGEIEGAAFARSSAPSVTGALGTLGLFGQLMFWLCPLAAGLHAGWRCLRQATARTPTALLLAASGLVIGGGWLASVMGDGYSELARHLHLAVNAALFGWLLLAVQAAEFWRKDRPALWTWCAVLVVPIALSAWALRAPAAVGRLTTPTVDRLESTGLQEVSGWVLTANQPTRVQICQGGRCSDAEVSADAAVGRFFPIADGRYAWRFSARLELQVGSIEIWLEDGRRRQLIAAHQLQ